MDTKDELVRSLATDAADGRLTRSELLQRAVGLGLGGAALVAFLAACGGSGGGEATTAATEGQASTASAATTAPTTSSASVGAIQRGGSARIATRVGGTADTLDPHHYATEADGDRVKALFNTLTHLDTNFKPQPSLAEEWDANSDGTVWTFRLVDGAVWHNGQPVTTDDVIYSFQRILDPKEGAVAKEAVSFIDPNGIKALDARTIRFTLKEPYVDMAASIGVDGNQIVPADFDPKQFNTAPIGTGPFKFQSFTPGKSSVFVRNENYFREGLPYLDQVEILNVFDENARNNAVLAGEVDLSTGIAFPSIEVLETGGAQIFDIPGGTFVDLSLVQDMEPFTDERVRQAFALSLDRDQIVEIVFLGRARVGNDQPISDSYPYAPQGIPQRQRDVDQAKQLLADAGYPDGLDATLYTSDAGFAMIDLAVVAANQAKDAGFNIDVKKWPPDSYWSEVWLKKNFYISWWSGHPTPDDLIGLTLVSNAPNNEPHFYSKDFDRLVTQARAEFDDTTRVDLYTQALTMVHDSASWVIPAYINLLHGATQKFHWAEAPNSQISIYTETAWVEA